MHSGRQRLSVAISFSNLTKSNSGPKTITLWSQSKYIRPRSSIERVDALKSTSVAVVIVSSVFPVSNSFASPSDSSYNGYFVKASYYSSGTLTASGERFDRDGFTAASRTLPFGTWLHVTNPATGWSVIVRINDRGPFVRGRDLDLARGAADALGMIVQGTATLKIVRLSPAAAPSADL
jgi:rare lipoprotein A